LFKFGLGLILILTLWVGNLLSETVLQESGPTGGAWHYLDDGSNQGTAWKETNFVYSSWSSGNPLLGFDTADPPEHTDYQTTLNSGHITYYFHKTFSVSEVEMIPALKLNILRDDGAVVYLNGTEVVRSNMPSGAITHTTLASVVTDGDAEGVYYGYKIDPANLVEGTNHLAVEVHQHTIGSSDVRFDLQLLAVGARKQPYLMYTGDNKTMQVNWQLYYYYQCSIEWGVGTSYSLGNSNTTEYGSDHQHKYLISDLTPGTKYYYRVTISDEVDEVYEGKFNAAPADGATDVSFLAYSDTQDNPNIHDGIAAEIISAYKAETKYQSIIIHAGDMAGEGDIESDRDGELYNDANTNIRELFLNLPIQAIMGNHEFTGALFDKYRAYPEPSPDPDGTTHQRYWSFDYGPVHFSMLDVYAYPADKDFGTAQLNWLSSDLSSTSKIWKVVVVHEPGWSAGVPDEGHSNNDNVQNYLHPLCRDNNVALVLNGHNHYYARALKDGVYYLTIGGGGGDFYTPDIDYGPSQPYLQKVSQSHHFCKIDVTDTVMSVNVYSTDIGSSIDFFSFAFDDPLPVFLNNFTVNYNSINTVLRWTTESEVNNLGWNIYRSESGYENDEFIQINSTLIDGMGTSTNPTNYSFQDEYQIVAGHTYWYWLQSVSMTNEFEIHGPVNIEIPFQNQLPVMTVLGANFPNPFNPETTIAFNIKENEKGILSIYNIQGQRIVEKKFEAGNHQYHWNAERLASGIYFYKLSSPTLNVTKKMILFK
jgi:Calcineurin-like phosphoesterase/Secretion system C-terminal sorting domain